MSSSAKLLGSFMTETDHGEQFESPLEEAEDYDYVSITEAFAQGDDDNI